MDINPQPPPDGDVSRQPELLAVINGSTVLALLFIVTRLYTRYVVVRSVGWDDYALILSGMCGIVCMAFSIEAVLAGEGRHVFYLGAAAIEARKWTQLSIVPNLFSATLARTSMCLFLLRIVDEIRPYKIMLWILLVFTNVTNLVCCICVYTQCQPLARLWDKKVPGYCWPSAVIFYISSVQGYTAIASDWIVALFPALILHKLNMPVRTKWAIGVIMGLGVFVGIAALMKSLSLGQLKALGDPTWNGFSLTSWSIIEQNVSIIAVSVPAIRPLFSRVFKTGFFGSHKTQQKYAPSSEFGHELGNMSGRSKGGLTNRATTTISVSRKAGFDDNSSESSLVRGSAPDQIVKRMSVELHVRKSTPANDPVESKNDDQQERHGTWLKL